MSATATAIDYAPQTFVQPFADFCATHLVQTQDQFAGQPLILEDWEVQFLGEALAYREDGEPYWQSVVLVVSRKNGKTALLAAYALYRLLADPGAPEILLAAASDSQAGRLFEAASTFVFKSPVLSDALTVRSYDGVILHREGNGMIRRLASDPKRLHGYNPSLVICDEVAMWSSPALRKAWGALTTGGAARRQAQTFSISVAGEAHERTNGILGQLIDRNEAAGAVQRPHEGLTISRNHVARTLVYNYSAPTTDPRDIDAMKLANPASWVTTDFLRRQAENPELADSEVLQLHGCVWSAQQDAWFQRAQWLACAAPGAVEDGESIAVGFDGSQFEDATALIGCRLSDGHLFTLGIWQKPEGAAGREWQVPRDQVDARLAAVMERYDVTRLACDPWEWWTEVERWQARWAGRVYVFRTDKRAMMAAATDRLHSAVLAGEVTHDDHPQFNDHVLNARTKDTPSGKTLRKDRSDSPRKIDAAVAAVLAYEARANAVALGGKSRELVTF